jgi:hypothetical protein
LLSLNEATRDFGDGGQLLLGGQSVVAFCRNTAGRQLHEACDAHHVEFVEIAVGNRQKPDPLEQGMTRITGLLENPFVEGEPR